MSGKTALVIDDNAANRDFLERLISSAGFTVLTATSGEEVTRATHSLPRLDIALIDMELPDSNGIQLTSVLRRRYPEAYLVVATVHDDFSLIESVFRKGGNVFVVKPHGFMELYKRLMTADLDALRQGACMVIDQYGARAYQPVAR